MSTCIFIFYSRSTRFFFFYIFFARKTREHWRDINIFYLTSYILSLYLTILAQHSLSGAHCKLAELTSRCIYLLIQIMKISYDMQFYLHVFAIILMRR